MNITGRTLTASFFVLLALVLTQIGGDAKGKIVGADLINQRAKSLAQSCADIGGVSTTTTYYDAAGNITAIVNTCVTEDSATDCEFAHEDVDCGYGTRPDTGVTEPQQVADPNLSPQESPTGKPDVAPPATVDAALSSSESDPQTAAEASAAVEQADASSAQAVDESQS
jgi:hypothetical protein